MNDLVVKYIGQIIVSLTVITVISGFNLSNTVRQQTLEIETLKDQVMNVELINEKFLNVDKNFQELKDEAAKRDEKLDKILEKL